MSLASAWNCSN